jgi:hypothetical protein
MKTARLGLRKEKRTGWHKKKGGVRFASIIPANQKRSSSFLQITRLFACLLPGYLLPGYLLPGYLLPGYLLPGYLLPGYLLPRLFVGPRHLLGTHDGHQRLTRGGAHSRRRELSSLYQITWIFADGPPLQNLRVTGKLPGYLL